MNTNRKAASDPYSEEFDSEQFVNQSWKYTIYTDGAVLRAMNVVSELVRWQNHAVTEQMREVLPYPGSVDSLLASAENVLTRLSDLFDSAGDRMENLAGHPDLHYDGVVPTSKEPHEVADDAAEDLKKISALTYQLYEAVKAVRGQSTARLGFRFTDDNGE